MMMMNIDDEGALLIVMCCVHLNKFRPILAIIVSILKQALHRTTFTLALQVTHSYISKLLNEINLFLLSNI